MNQREAVLIIKLLFYTKKVNITFSYSLMLLKSRVSKNETDNQRT